MGDRYTDNVEGIYKITIKFVIETLIEGFEKGRNSQNHVESSKDVNLTTTSNNANDNGANATSTTKNGDTSYNTTKDADAS